MIAGDRFRLEELGQIEADRHGCSATRHGQSDGSARPPRDASDMLLKGAADGLVADLHPRLHRGLPVPTSATITSLPR